MFAATHQPGRPVPAGETMHGHRSMAVAKRLLRRPDDSQGDAQGGAQGAGQAAPQTASRLVELFAGERDAGAIGFALAQLPAARPVLWVQDRMSQVETGLPYAPGLARFGLKQGRVLSVCASKPADVLWAMEEGLRCAALGAVIGEIWGSARALDFTATRRLAMRAERSGITVFLIRFTAQTGLSAARQRWRIASAPSTPDPYDLRAPGKPRWQAELFRTRDAKPGQWEAGYDAKAHRLDFSAAFHHPALAPPHLGTAGSSGEQARRSGTPGAAWPAGA